MKSIKRILICVLIAAAILLSVNGVYSVEAASDCIRVTSAITSERLYSGNDLQEAFDAAERGCIVSIGRTYRMTQDVVLDAEIMISGQNFLRFNGYSIQLSGNGAIYVAERFSRSTYVTALNPEYNEVEWVQESGGYIYYLVPTSPNMDDYEPEIRVEGSEFLLGAQVLEEDGVIIIDPVSAGISTTDFAAAVDSASSNDAETFTISFTDDVAGLVANGTVMTVTASNTGYTGTVSKIYTIYVLGDVNRNGRVDSADASMIACYAAGLQELDGIALEAADANYDGDITDADAQFLCQKYVTDGEYVSPLSR